MKTFIIRPWRLVVAGAVLGIGGGLFFAFCALILRLTTNLEWFISGIVCAEFVCCVFLAARETHFPDRCTCCRGGKS